MGRAAPKQCLFPSLGKARIISGYKAGKENTRIAWSKGTQRVIKTRLQRR
jgi:hypothetical protein